MTSQDDKPPKEDMGWMYAGPSSIIDTEKYLLGRKIDKNYELFGENLKKEVTKGGIDGVVQKEVELKHGHQHQGHGVNTLLAVETIKHEDPLVAIKVKEELKKRELLDNPMKMKKLQKLILQTMAKKLGTDQQSSESDSSSDEKSKRIKRRSDSNKDEQRKSTSGGSNHDRLKSSRRSRQSPAPKDSDSESSSDDEQSKRAYRRNDSKRSNNRRYDGKSTNRDRNGRNWRRSRSPQNSRHCREDRNRNGSRSRRSRSHSPKKANEKRKNAHTNKRSRSPEPSKHKEEYKYTDSESETEQKKKRNAGYGLVNYDKKHDNARKRQSPVPEYKEVPKPASKKKKMTEEDRGKMLEEMKTNAKWRNEERKRTAARLTLEEKKEEEELLNRGKGKHQAFIRPMLSAAAESGSVEERVKSLKHKIQRSSDSMMTNFARK